MTWRIEEYISRDNPDAAAQLILVISEKLAVLSEQPAMGRNRPDLSPDLRGFPAGNYIIFYHAAGDGIDVARVLHGARDIPELFSLE